MLRKTAITTPKKANKKKQKLTFNIAYYPAFQNVRGIIKELHILLTCNKEHKKVFPNVPVIGFRMARALRIS